MNTESQEFSVSFNNQQQQQQQQEAATHPANRTFSELIRNVISRQTNATDVLNEMGNMPNFDELDGSDLFAQVLADRSPFARIEGVSFSFFLFGPSQGRIKS